MKHLVRRNQRSPISLLILLVVGLSAVAQTSPKATDTNSPVGHWVAEHPSYGGIGSWWNFRPDGTLTMYVGAMATSPLTRSGDTLTMPSGQEGRPPIPLTYKIDGNTLHLKTPEGHETVFTRIGTAPSPADPLLGQWRPNPPATLSSDSSEAGYQKALANATYLFSADGTQSIRIPFTSHEGTWSSSTHMLQVQGSSKTYSFSRSGAKLTLGQPPDNKQTDTYLPDPLFQ